MDRGYDAETILEHILSKGLDIIVRMKDSRHMLLNGKPENVHAVAEKVKPFCDIWSNETDLSRINREVGAQPPHPRKKRARSISAGE